MSCLGILTCRMSKYLYANVGEFVSLCGKIGAKAFKQILNSLHSKEPGWKFRNSVKAFRDFEGLNLKNLPLIQNLGSETGTARGD